MDNNSNIVEPLKKVTLEFTVGITPELKDWPLSLETLEFIYGIGTEGLTEFECVLDGKQTGDKGSVEIIKGDMAEIFGHIIPCTYVFSVDADRFYMHYKITGISDTSPSDVVKSMAAAAGGGCGGSCGCGCGFH